MSDHFLFFAGSARRDSLNKRLASQAAAIASSIGVDARFIDLADYPMPLYDGDLEASQGLPETAIALKARFREAQGFFLASPEYNGSFSALVKNTLDWMSRSAAADEPPLIAYRNKVAGLAAASPGGLGGLRALVPLRMLLNNLGVTVVPQQLAVASAANKLGAAGVYEDESIVRALTDIIKAMARLKV